MSAFFSSPLPPGLLIPSCSCSYLSWPPQNPPTNPTSSCSSRIRPPKPPTTLAVYPVRARSAAARRSGIGEKEALWWFLRANLAAIRSDLDLGFRRRRW